MDSGTDWDGEPRGVGEMLGSVPTQVGPANCPPVSPVYGSYPATAMLPTGL